MTAGEAGRKRFRGRCRYLTLGLATLTGLSARGYFIPYGMRSSLPSSASRTSYPALEAAFASRAGTFAAFTRRMSGYCDNLRRSAVGVPPAPRLDQNWFPPFDALAAYTMIREFGPRMILEIGGGHSTRIFVQAAADGDHACRVTVVEPQPRRALVLLAESARVVLHRCPLQSLAPGELPELQSGDVLSLDGSHILMPGSDTDAVLNRILPTLPAGVLIHFHDIFLPDPYPESWAWRGYNEQLGVAALLTGGAAEVLFSSRYMLTRHPEAAAMAGLETLPLSRAPASSLWLRWRG